VTTSGGSVTLKSGMNDAGDEVIVKGVVNTGGGKFTATARGDVLIDATAPVTTGGGNVELTSAGARVFIDNDIITGGGSATFKAATSFVTDDTDAGANNLDQILTSGGDVSITANNIILGHTGT